MRNRLFSGLITIFFLGSCNFNSKTEPKDTLVNISSMAPIYVGTYTKKEGHVDGKAEGIYTVYQDRETGILEMGETVAKITNPSFLKTTADKKFLYAVSELGPGDGHAGLLFSYRINDDHSLKEIGSVSTESFAPCYIAEDHSGQYIFVANYVGGVVMMYKKNENGSLKELQKIILENPEDSHPHSVNISEDNKFIYIPDLGQDRIWIFDLDARGDTLTPHKTPYYQLSEGAGPRHFTLSKNGDFAYTVNELNGSISSFKLESNGSLSHLGDISTLPDDFTGKNSAADIHLHPSGKFLYASNRGHNSIVSYSVNEVTGNLQNIAFTPTQGETPRNFAISPDGNFLYVANQDSNNIVPFKIDSATGKLQAAEQQLEIKTPVCIEFWD